MAKVFPFLRLFSGFYPVMFSNNFSFSFIKSAFPVPFSFCIHKVRRKPTSLIDKNIYFTTDFDSPVFAEAMLEQPSLLSLDHVFMPQFYAMSQRVIVGHLSGFESLSRELSIIEDRFDFSGLEHLNSSSTEIQAESPDRLNYLDLLLRQIYGIMKYMAA